MKRFTMILTTAALAACGAPAEETASTEAAAQGGEFVCPADCDVVPGDANVDGQANIFDTAVIIAYLFGGGPQPCLVAADANQDGNVDISDSSLISAYANGQDVTLQGPACDLCPSDCNQILSGDVNADGRVDISDYFSIYGWLFNGNPLHVCEIAADVNGDGNVDVSDLVTFNEYFTRGGPLAAPICQ